MKLWSDGSPVAKRWHRLRTWAGGAPVESASGAPLSEAGSGHATPLAAAPQGGKKPLPLASLFVWSCWLVLSAAAVLFVHRYGGNMPVWDEFELVRVYTHEQPVTFDYLWMQHNEHRIPLPRLVQIGLARLTASDFRAGMYFNVAVMALLAAWMIRLARTIRGGTSYADAFFPVVLLHWGHSENFLWSFQVAFSLSTLLSCAALGSIVGRGREAALRGGELSFGPAVLAGLCLILLPLCGAQGPLLALPVALWLGFVGARSLIARRFRDWKGAVVVGLSLAACVLVVAYFIGYAAPTCHPAPPNLKSWARTSLGFLLAGFGPAAERYHTCGALGLTALGAVVFFALLAAWKSRPQERVGVMGLLFFLASMLALAVAVGKGRAFLGPGAGFASRYVMLSAPFILALYLAAGRWGGRGLARFVQACLFLVAVWFVVGNFQGGRVYGRERRDHYEAIKAAVQSGASPEVVAAKCGAYFFPDPAFFLSELKSMEKCRIGPYRLKAPKSGAH